MEQECRGVIVIYCCTRKRYVVRAPKHTHEGSPFISRRGPFLIEVPRDLIEGSSYILKVEEGHAQHTVYFREFESEPKRKPLQETTQCLHPCLHGTPTPVRHNNFPAFVFRTRYCIGLSPIENYKYMFALFVSGHSPFWHWEEAPASNFLLGRISCKNHTRCSPNMNPVHAADT